MAVTEAQCGCLQVKDKAFPVWSNCHAQSQAHALQEQDEGDSGTVHYHFVQQALQPLVEMLLKLLSKQEEGQDEDDGIWNLSLAGGNCLSLVAAVVGDEVLALVMPYIQVCSPYLQREHHTEDPVQCVAKSWLPHVVYLLSTSLIHPEVYETPAPGMCQAPAIETLYLLLCPQDDNNWTLISAV